LITAYLGWRMTVNPISHKDPTQKRKRTIYEGLFVSAGLVGVFLGGLTAYRSPRERAHLAFQPVAAYEITGTSFSWASGPVDHRASFLQVDQPLAFNIWYLNVGSGPAMNIMGRSHTFLEP